MGDYEKMSDFKKINGELVLVKIKVSHIAEKKAIKNNNSSGKTLVPKKLIGKGFMC